MSLPVPKRPRWQPLRGGLMNLYLFEDLQLRYEDGRLLLRGNNGAGKSRILALQLPFLLDGEISPARVEPDGDPSKRIEWHLLLDGKFSDRVGYTWLELGRVDEDGTERFCTIGCGMKAVQGKGAPSRWYFVTERRVGVDLRLEDKQRVPFKRPALEEMIGARGKVFDRASEYRAAVDHALFGLGEHRYRALLDLLIQLRRPQLSRKLDEGQLSDALSLSLPPLSEAILGDVAEAFRSLESERRKLEEDRQALGATLAFTKSYRRYVEMATRRRAATVRTAHSAYEHAARELRVSKEELDAAERAHADIVRRLQDTERAHLAASASVRELEADPTHRDARRLDELGAQARAARDAAGRATNDAVRAEEELVRCRDAVAAAHGHVAEEEAHLEESAQRAERGARTLGLDGLLMPLDALFAPNAEAACEERVQRLGRQVDHLVGLARSRGQAEGLHEKARTEAQRAKEELDRAHERRVQRQAERDAHREELENRLTLWADELEVTLCPDLDLLLEALAEWSEHGEGEGPVAAAVESAFRVAFTELTEATSALGAERARVLEARRGLEREQYALRSGDHRPPLAPPWRDPSGRGERDGAPLWALTDFVETVEPSARAGFEAALEASGILDAWVSPDGQLRDGHLRDGHLRDGADAFLVPLAVAGPTISLATVLRPVIDRGDPRASAVRPEAVARILESIAAEPTDGAPWVAADGRFALGPLVGLAHKDEPEHIGQGAREAARRRRLESLEHEILELTSALDALDARIADHRRRMELADRERAAAPRETALRDAIRAMSAAEREQHERAAVSRERAVELEVAASALAAARAKLAEDAQDLGFAAWTDRIDGLREAHASLTSALSPVWIAVRAVGRVREQLVQRADGEARATSALDAKRCVEREAEERSEELGARHRVLRETVGAKVEELQRRLGEVRAIEARAKRETEALRADKSAVDQRTGAARQAVQERNERVKERDSARGATFVNLQALARTGVWSLLGDPWRALDAQSEWSGTRAVEIARDLEKELDAVTCDDAAWDRTNTNIQQRVQDLTSALSSHGLNPVTSYESDILLVGTSYQGQILAPDGLALTLDEEISSRQRILDEREREILENHLLVEVASHLHQQIREGERLVLTMNREIESRPLSTGMRLRFKWVAREEAGLAEVRKRLLAAQGAWSPEDRKAIGEFLQRRIHDERARSETGTWLEHLERALDYRAWHQFHIERFQNQTWKKLTKKTYGTGSGGEKAIALTLPQLAAAAAHYQSASPHAPRLILMDEAFVGVDSDMRAKCMGLLTAFDLDFVMTSEREWGCYESVPALAIYQLVTRPGFDAVHETRWVWNGRTRERDADAEPTAPMSAPSASG